MGSGASKNKTRNIYIRANGKTQRLKFTRSCSPTELKDLVSVACGVTKWKSVQLSSDDGSLVAISWDVPENDESAPYVATVIAEDSVVSENDRLAGILTQVSDHFVRAFNITELRKEIRDHLSELKKRVETVEGLKAVEIEKCKKEINQLREMMYARKKYNSEQYIYNEPDKVNISRSKIPLYTKYTLSQETIDYLKKPTFDIWQWEPNEMLSLLEHMYHELDIVRDLNINPITLRRWLLCVQENYRNNPFHNFRHCFCVTQMMYGMIYACQLDKHLTKAELATLLTSAVCHDLDHPGYNNAYQINAKTELAIRYNDISPLENHHCAVCFKILNKPECNVFANTSESVYREIRKGIISLILATDMAKHGEITEQFRSTVNDFDVNNEKHRTCVCKQIQNYTIDVLKMILIKCCDISNEVRPMEISDPWADCLLEEFFQQGDREKSEGLPVAPFMDREKVTKSSTQIGFIKYVLIPLFELFSEVFPNVRELLVIPLMDALERYEKLKQIEEVDANKANNEKNEEESSEKLRAEKDKDKINDSRRASACLGKLEKSLIVFHAFINAKKARLGA
ncbi:High affinity cGMP-specific 3',5'-cyclic phosphodiesterase 9A [Trichoplax sp. H2]|uniref:Phosphodiesterase n=1 Tax=Trichoplax adhaerens TaxID=10228 RepID=B3RW84_TRIAD|nr:hypothetical protein TRIADDRAFT_55920 [Trichoplax adhaerens]EDV25625.1 hypothetical protein TRIADDRAFT_55920 [Trichoplax adhaerens]RDD40846.1 High affinity cGMP-specific 3',5'-cyclic phosphodiesterase 9A [Trichoplax sp. H2]|eukprot:XP_002111658.1 hypothetical protein TRIADDRAFT_55920 [Trichoplax adhaerens]